MATSYIWLNTEARVDAAYDLITPEIIAEVKDDFGDGVRLPSRQRVKNWIASPNHRLVGAHDGGVAQGFGVGERLGDGRWQIVFVMVISSLTAQQRAAIFRGMMVFVSAPPILGTTPYMGKVPQGRRLDQLLQARGFANRTVLSPDPVYGKVMVEYNTNAAEMQAKL